MSSKGPQRRSPEWRPLQGKFCEEFKTIFLGFNAQKPHLRYDLRPGGELQINIHRLGIFNLRRPYSPTGGDFKPARPELHHPSFRTLTLANALLRHDVRTKKQMPFCRRRSVIILPRKLVRSYPDTNLPTRLRSPSNHIGIHFSRVCLRNWECSYCRSQSESGNRDAALLFLLSHC